MTTTDIRKVKDKDLRGSFAALKRAARDARSLALQTHTPLYIWQNGRVVNILARSHNSRPRAA